VTAGAETPLISVVLATRDRPERLARAFGALRAQTLPPSRYEIVVVDDGSGEETRDLLDREQQRPDPPELRVLRQAPARGPATARNRGWRAARAPLVAFTDDDCEPAPGWLEGLLAVAEEHPGAIVQGPTLPIPDELPSFGPFSHTVVTDAPSRGFETANIMYPRELLERLDGFDEQSFPLAFGEDTDLAWRAIEAGAEPQWAPGALVHHAVTQLGPLRKLRHGRRAEAAVLPFARHRGLRQTRHLGIFWNRHHAIFVRALVALVMPRRLWWLRWWLAAPYVAFLVERRSGPLLAPYLIAHDAIEVGSCVRGSLRYRVLVI
jgi:glycosyltransferase involved in cell wall biosynthesis